MSGFRRAFAIFCLAAIIVAALAIVPAYALLAWVLVSAPFLFDTLRTVRAERARVCRALPTRPAIRSLAPRAPPCFV